MPDAPARDAVFTAYARSLIRFKSRQLSRKPGFGRSDEEDIAQELSLRLLARAHLFDPDRASVNTFAARVIDSAVAMILRDRHRLKRGSGTTPVSLDATRPRSEEPHATIGSGLTPLDAARRLGILPPTPVRSDRIAVAIESLSAEDQAIARALMTDPPSVVARRLGISRRQVRNAMARIRRHFAKADLDET